MKFMEGPGHLRLCYRKTGEETWSGCECGVCWEPSGDLSGHWSCCCEEALVPAVRAWGGARVAPGGCSGQCP